MSTPKTIVERAIEGKQTTDPLAVLAGLLPLHTETARATNLDEDTPPTVEVESGPRDPPRSFTLDQLGEESAKLDRLATLTERADAMLKPTRAFLSRFQDGLHNMLAQMESLQTRSHTLATSLDLAKTLEAQLGPVIADIAIAPSLIRDICQGTVSAAWVENIRIVTEKSELLEKYERNTAAEVPVAVVQSREILELLTLKIVERVRDFIIKQIKVLRRGSVPSQRVQRLLLDVREAYAFLHANHKALALELRQAYVFTMRWYYRVHFSNYIRALEKLKLHQVGPGALLGSEGAVETRGQSFFAVKKQLSMSMDTLALGARALILDVDDKTVVPALVAETSPMTYWMETAFRMLNLALVDNGTVEYLFMAEFFQPVAADALEGLFGSVFQPTHQLGVAFTKELIETHDAFGVLLCIRVCQALERELQSRRVPVMESYLNLQMITLWPRFQLIIDGHCDSMRRASARTGFINPGAVVPHRLTQQFSMFLLGLIKLSSDVSGVEPLLTSITRLRGEFEAVLTKILAGFKGRSKEVFLFNNYFLVLTVLEGETIHGTVTDVARDQCQHFKLLLDAYGAHA